MSVSFLTTMPCITWSFCSQALDPLACLMLEGAQQTTHGFLVLGWSSKNPTCWVEFLSLAGDLPSFMPLLNLEENESP